MDPRILADASESTFWNTWRLQLTIPSILARDEELAVRITAFGPDSLPSSDFDREIVFEESPGVEGLPKSVRLDPAGGGCLAVDGLRAVGQPFAYVVARPEGCPRRVKSNPAWVFDEPPYRIYWGDLHVHTTYSNCSAWACKDPEFCYAYARDATHLDFCAAADHLHGIASDKKRWPRLQELVRQYDDPGRFVPFLAFESSHKSGYGGDNNAYFLHADAPYFQRDHPQMAGTSPEISLRELWDFLDATGKAYFTAPHHTGRALKYRSFWDPVYDPEREPLFEIYSLWGSSESWRNRFPLYAGNSDQPCYFQDALKAGCRYGVIASSDDHCTLPGGESQSREPAGLTNLAMYQHHGLAAVRTKDLTRESLWQAMRERNCYATTMARTLLDVAIVSPTASPGGSAWDDTPAICMGQERYIEKRDPLRKHRTVLVKALSTERGKAEVVCLRNGVEFERVASDLDGTPICFEDHDPFEEIALRATPFHPKPFVVYYVRVENQFNQTQWSSPIWLDLEP